MIERKISSANAGDEQLKQLYQTAFPENEQIPWDDLMRLVGEMHLDFTAYYDENTLIGFTIVYPRPSFSWYWYFAVKEGLRGKGLGQQILSQLIERYKGLSSVLDVESTKQNPCPNLEQRQRRHAFYLRNGFRDTNIYRWYGDIEMTMMVMGPGEFTMQDWDDIVSELRRFWTWD
ncbi:MAG: GNAT family N-acetyltransferase [Prevotella sp.]|nr:GNAT family N-acetyltransferase [Prevotella sp.]